jgi:hypothetical protein
MRRDGRSVLSAVFGMATREDRESPIDFHG